MTLPFPIGTDAPCEFPEQWCETITGINAKVAEYESVIDRTYPAIPVCVLRATVSQTLPALLDAVTFTEAAIDTAGMSDLDANPKIITVPKNGVYTVQGFIHQITTVALNSVVDVQVFFQSIPSGFGDFRGRTRSLGVGSSVQVSTARITSFWQAGTIFSLGTSSAVQVLKASLSVAWHADQERAV